MLHVLQPWLEVGSGSSSVIHVQWSMSCFQKLRFLHNLPQRRLLFEEKPSHQLQTLPRIIAEHYEPFVVHCHNTFVHFTKLAKNKKKLENLIVSVHNRDDKKKKKREKQRHWGSVTWQNSLFLLFGRNFSLRRRSIQSFVVITNNETKHCKTVKNNGWAFHFLLLDWSEYTKQSISCYSSGSFRFGMQPKRENRTIFLNKNKKHKTKPSKTQSFLEVQNREIMRSIILAFGIEPKNFKVVKN
mgnify:CR=1 FL=1